MTVQFDEHGNPQNWHDPEIFGAEYPNFGPTPYDEYQGTAYILDGDDWVIEREFSGVEVFEFVTKLALVGANERGEIAKKIEAQPGGTLTLFLQNGRKVILEIPDDDVLDFLGD